MDVLYIGGNKGVIPFSRGKFVGPVACKITAVSPITVGDDPPVEQNIFKYTVQALVWDQENYVASSDTYTNQEFFALNMHEIGNTPTTAMGVSIASLPTGFSFESAPVGAGVLVWMATGGAVDANGFKTLAIFQWPNQFNGTCE